MLGFGGNQFWSPDNYYRSILLTSLGSAIIAAYFFFSQGLRLRTESVVGEWVLRSIAAVTLVTLLAMSITGYQTTALSLTFLTLACSIAIVVISVRLALGGNQFAIFSSVASGLVLIGSIQHGLVRLQFVPIPLFLENSVFVGFMLLVGCLALGVGFEVHRRRQEQDQYERAWIAQTQVNQEAINAALESEVQTRTQELEKTLNDLSAAHESLKELNTVDQVTGTKNRYHFDTTFSQEWNRASREGYPLSLLMLDVDHFKQVNDNYGHVAGDECLRQIGLRLAGNIKRAADTLARFGGEEFVILLPFSTNENAVKLAEQLRRSVAATPMEVDGEQIQIYISIGVCTVIPRDNDQSKDLITSADLALYEAKSAGRNRVSNAGMLKVHTNRGNKKA